MRTIHSTWSLALVGAVGASLIAGCVGAPEPPLEASPSVGVAGAWNPPDATVVLRGSGCELNGDAGVVDPGLLTIEFVNDSFHEGYIKVVRVPPGRRLGDLRAWIGMAGGWGELNAPEATDIWSSPRAVTSGTWAVVCFKDLAAGPRTFTIVRAGVAGPIKVG